MLKRLKSSLPDSTKHRVREWVGPLAHLNTSFSQEGEDILLARMFNDGRVGTYVDVGAHHPYRFSNTYKFYRLGWRGINVDAMPGSMELFRKRRSRDINLELGVAEEAGEMTFNVFSEPALNTFDAAIAKAREQDGNPIQQRVKVQCKPLSAIIAENPLPANGNNSFLSIDVEGLDLQVLRSNDWSKYRPSLVVAEDIGKSIDELASGAVAIYLRDQGYVFFSKLAHSCFFKRIDF